MVEVVRIFWGLREDKMGNMPRGGTCMGRKVGPRKLKIINLLFSDRYLQHSRQWKINQENFFFVQSKKHFSVESRTGILDSPTVVSFTVVESSILVLDPSLSGWGTLCPPNIFEGVGVLDTIDTLPYQGLRYTLLLPTVAWVHFLNLKPLVCILISMGSTWDIDLKYWYKIPQGFEYR